MTEQNGKKLKLIRSVITAQFADEQENFSFIYIVQSDSQAGSVPMTDEESGSA